jgi:hypothetical protein
VPAGLEPDPEPPVFEQHHAARPDDDARPGHVDGIGFLIERCRQRIEEGQEPLDRDRFTLVHRSACTTSARIR